jgi:hypothetical protein
MNGQLLTQGVIVGMVPGYEDFVRVTSGVFTITAYVPFSSPAVAPGECWTLTKIGFTYALGTKVIGR